MGSGTSQDPQKGGVYTLELDAAIALEKRAPKSPISALLVDLCG
jgi:hypothetical protein